MNQIDAYLDAIRRLLPRGTRDDVVAELRDALLTAIASEETERGHRLTDAETYFATVAARVVIGGGRACYVPALDEIHIPALDRFDEASAYYSTAAHEHVHWTGHTSRPARDLTGRFGDRAYGAEDLVAELGAAYWCAQFGLEQATRKDHAA